MGAYKSTLLLILHIKMITGRAFMTRAAWRSRWRMSTVTAYIRTGMLAYIIMIARGCFTATSSWCCTWLMSTTWTDVPIITFFHVIMWTSFAFWAVSAWSSTWYMATTSTNISHKILQIFIYIYLYSINPLYIFGNQINQFQSHIPHNTSANTQ